MQKFILAIFALSLAGCGQDQQAGNTSASGSLEQRVEQLEQRVDRIESTAMVVGPENPEQGSEYPGLNAVGNASGNQAGNTVQQ